MCRYAALGRTRKQEASNSVCRGKDEANEGEKARRRKREEDDKKTRNETKDECDSNAKERNVSQR